MTWEIIGNIEGRRVWGGTEAERLAFDTTTVNMNALDIGIESDTGNEYGWSGHDEGVDQTGDWFQTKSGGIPVTLSQGSGVPSTYTKITTNSAVQDVIKGQLNKIKIFPAILNEHVESSREIQGVVSSGNIVGQIFKAAVDNITGLMFTLESAAGVSLDTFESYADTAALILVWVKGGTNDAALEEVIVKTGSKAMSLPGDILNDDWVDTITSTDYTNYTFSFDFRQDTAYANLKYEFTLSDGTNTLSHSVVVVNTNVWEKHDIDINSMIDSGTTNKAAITDIGFRVIDKRVGNTGYVDNLVATPPPGDIEIKLWDMGTTKPVSAATSIDDGTQYEKIGVGESSSFILALDGGKRLYNVHDFLCGADKSIPTNQLLIVDHYYILELKYVDTDVSVYGPDTSFTNDYYTNGYAFTVADEATAIAAIGTYSDIMFGIFSRQPIYITKTAWRMDAEPNGEATIAVFLEDANMGISCVIIDHEHSPEQSFTADISLRPAELENGGKLEHYYNDDHTDSVSRVVVEMTFLHEPPHEHV